MKKLAVLLPASLILAGCTLPFGAGAPGVQQSNQQEAMGLAQIMQSGGQAKCTITNLADNSVMAMEVSGQKMRVSGDSFGQGKPGTMINDGTYAWIWSEGETTGFKTKINQDNAVAEGDESMKETDFKTPAAYEDESKYKLDCTQQNIPDSEFTPPADVTFTDTEQMMMDAQDKMKDAMEKMPSGMPSGLENMPEVPGMEK